MGGESEEEGQQLESNMEGKRDNRGNRDQGRERGRKILTTRRIGSSIWRGREGSEGHEPGIKM